MKRFSLMVALLLLLSACAKPSGPGAGKPTLKWTGTALEGAQFYIREMPSVTVHYALPTLPDQAEAAGKQTAIYLADQMKRGQAAPDERVDLWILPAGQPWPEGLAQPFGRAVHAVAPDVLISPEFALTEKPEVLAAVGFAEATALAVTQPAGSLAFTVPWLHEGMGTVMRQPVGPPTGPVTGPTTFPLRHYVQMGGFRPRNAMDIMNEIANPSGLSILVNEPVAALILDRWGSNWASLWPDKPEALTPMAALQWVTGATDPKTIADRVQERMNYVVQYGQGVSSPPTQADISPLRIEPKLAALPKGPGPGDNYSPQTFEISARYEPLQRTVIGTEMLTWQNGEGIPVDTLYFNLWPNAEQYALYGGAITVSAVKVDGADAAFQARNLDLVVPLGRAVQPGQQVAVTVQFTTRMPKSITTGALGQDGRRFSLAHWYPSLAVLDDRGWQLGPLSTFASESYAENATYHVSLDVPAGTVLGATGHQTGRQEQGDRWVYTYDAPNVKDWAAGGGPGMKEITRQVGSTTIRVIHDDAALAVKAAGEVEKALGLFTAKFGAYPYPDLVVGPWSGGLDSSGVIFVDGSVKPFPTAAFYHAVAHQWFYGIVGNDQYGEAWLDEGFARYGERLAVRAFGLASQVRDLSKFALPRDQHVTHPASGTYGHAEGGAVALEDLQARLGTATFDRVMQAYVQRFKFRTATTADFIKTAEEVSGQDLSVFFREHKIDPADRQPYHPRMPLGKGAAELPFRIP